MKTLFEFIPDFAMPWLFLLLIPAAAAAWILWHRKEPAIRFPSLAEIGRINRHIHRIDWKKLIPFTLVCAAVLLVVAALARPREGLEEIRRRSEGVDIILALDLSGSMGAIDVPKKISTRGELDRGLASGAVADRLTTAKREIAKFIDARPADRIGLLVFAPLPYMACPPTLDHAWLIANLEGLQPGLIGDKTNIAGPVASAVRRLKDSDAKRKIIVLFTDGSNNISAKVTPRQAAKLANTFDITVYTVGIGSKNAVFLQDTPFGKQLVPIQNDFDEALLRDMAASSSGRYYRAEDAESMAAAMKEIDSLEKTSFEQQTTINWRELAFPMIGLAAAFLTAAFLLRHTVWLRTP